jgi:NADH dehydrogenase [ubiquinone] 1 alpha subcomplex assembly factor 5
MLPFHKHILPRVPKFHSRSLASIADTVAPVPYQIFDRYAKVLQKDRSAAPSRVQNSRTVDYVRDETAGRLIERMLVSVALWFFFVYPNA